MTQNVSAIILYNENKEFLLQKRDTKTSRSPGKWGFFGGRIEENENKFEAVIREAYEELKYALDDPKFITKKIINGKGEMNIFIEKYDNSQEIILGEGESYGWFKIKEIKELDMIEHDREALLEIAEKIDFY
ncbi:MAG: NUDIX domain-containing protein [Nanoarchaeota archaeon]|nr:NUDIX domain-containing protein [Nanoarchaeota archaeon]